MIITVTLNTAIDKTLEVPNFRIGRRHRSVAQTTMPGGKGVNVARAIKLLGRAGDRDRLHGRLDRHPHRRRADGRVVLTDFVRIGEESRTNTAVLDPTTGIRRRSTSAARRSPSARWSCSATSCCTSRRARSCACSPAACRASVDAGRLRAA